VGFGAYLLGGRGQVAGLTCAGVALASILAGKYLAIQQFVGTEGPKDLYDLLLPQAEAYVQVQSERDCRAFMVQNEYTEATTPEQVSGEELLMFQLTAAPMLDDLGRNRPSFAEWQERPLVKAYFQEAGTSSSIFGMLFDSLNLIDLIFAFLGIATAYRVCNREEPAFG
jgi:hypothetical protein